MKGIVFGGGKCGYLSLPKTASTSIKHAIYEMESGEGYCIDKTGIFIHAYMKKKHVGDLSNCVKRFIVVRDPIKRFLSAFKNRVHFHDELSESFIKNNFPESYWDIPYFAPGLGQFVEHIESYLQIRPIFHHCRPMVDFLDGQGLDYFSHVYKFEDICKFEKDLSGLVDGDINFRHTQSGGKKYSVRDLSEAQIEKLIEYYDDDYKLLEGIYSVDELWSEWKGIGHDPKVPRAKNNMIKVMSSISAVVCKLKK